MITAWFQVQVVHGSELQKVSRLATHIYYWARRRENGTYDIFGNSQHGPYVNSVTERQMIAGANSIRNDHGRLRVATPDEARDIEYHLNWFLGK